MADKLTGPALEEALAARGLPSEGNADDKRAAVAKFDADNESSITEPVPVATAAPETTTEESPVVEEVAAELGIAPSTSTASTTLDSDFTKPSVTAPGDGPADTTDPLERAQSVTPIPGAEALAVGTVNAVVPAQFPTKPQRDESKDRFEQFESTAPNGSKVWVRRNLETGESVVLRTETGAVGGQRLDG
ncbi:hypothetical protein CH274_15415 [Rhodococcus sp. 06-418-5]|uniref:hypothetical protein n=1 Tax=unclassified Rhodococcus (in: high G+C Gram-positive bacteria) TaxID=192944 RepID=UPI000B9B8642|nr:MULTISPECIES: hypothetical protein [unclassified Rhodococcus (in: high G+C Gram-positive bacteria)]OZC80557.1 hypothetical protein CH274_15415 [Rhodococcus sp. 06-418-5]OZE13374.1 hypothetical protein CH250_05525 [Rhodococcus sp. 05-2255-3C]OZE16013.1 hypothetical protein CH249_01840 [Rhodococcus sp. 05-2255-3B1]OZE19053.1 hypothetical protein CH255_13865 [Rhodococcus sp. 05-2255-2A2]